MRRPAGVSAKMVRAGLCRRGSMSGVGSSVVCLAQVTDRSDNRRVAPPRSRMGARRDRKAAGPGERTKGGRDSRAAGAPSALVLL